MPTTSVSLASPPSQHKQPNTTTNYFRHNSLNSQIGRTLRRIRMNKDLTLRNVAKNSNVALAFICEVELGQKVASSSTVEALCRGLGITTVEFYTELITTIEKGW